VEPGEEARWETIPGLLQLVEAGASVDDLAEREFVAPSVRGVGVAGSDLTPKERGQVDRLWDWLKGFRRAEMLIERMPIWVPIAEGWPVPGGSLEFSYELSTARETSAELTVLGIGFGGGSRRTLSSSISMTGSDAGVGYYTRAYLTVHRYQNVRNKQELLSADVDGCGEIAEDDSRDLAFDGNPLQSAPLRQNDLAKLGYTALEVKRFAQRRGPSEITAKREVLRKWKFEVGLPVPHIKDPLKLSATCERAETFDSKFTLPGGRDYALCAKTGELPVIPLCVPLAADGSADA